MRVVDRVHRGTANGWADAFPPFRAGFAHDGVLVFTVGKDADGGDAFGRDEAKFARREFDGTIAIGAFLTSVAEAPAGALSAASTGTSSTLCTMVPIGISESGMALPGRMSIETEETESSSVFVGRPPLEETTSPALAPSGAKIYLGLIPSG